MKPVPPLRIAGALAIIARWHYTVRVAGYPNHQRPARRRLFPPETFQRDAEQYARDVCALARLL
jgi:hypothetical protein